MTVQEEYELSCYKEIMSLNKQGTVILARHIHTGQIVVKKSLTVYEREVYEKLYELQDRSLSQINQGIPQVLFAAEQDGKLIVLESYIEGSTLKDRIEEDGIWNETDTATLGIKLCEILNRLHTMNPPLIHRDIKPSNLILDNEGNLFLIDFNASKFYKEEKSEDTVLLGTKGYAAPEQYGFGQSSIRSDIFATGVLMQLMLTGERSNTLKYTGAMAPIIEKCLRMEAEERYRNVVELENALRSFLKLGRVADLTDSRDNFGIDPQKPLWINRSFYRNPYLPVGFRTGTIWKMIVGASVYIFFLECLVQGVFTKRMPRLPEKIFFTVLWILLFLTTVGYWGNYGRIRDRMIQTDHPALKIFLSFFFYLVILAALFLLSIVPYSFIG